MDKKEFDIRSKFTGARAFLTIPASLSMDEDLLNKPKSIILLGHIVSMLNVTQIFYMSNKAIAERLKVSKPTVSDYLNLLESKHIIIREKILKFSRSFYFNYYLDSKNPLNMFFNTHTNDSPLLV